MDQIALPEWLVWISVLGTTFGVRAAYRMGRASGWRDFSGPAKPFWNHEEDGL